MTATGDARRTALGGLLAALAVAALCWAPPSAAATHTQRRAAPWATVNVCDPPARPGSIGVRVSVPNRRDAAQWVRIRIQFYDTARRRWRFVRSGGDGGFARLSAGGHRVLGGTTFTFAPPRAGRRLILRGLVDVEWRRGVRVVSRARVTTRGGHSSKTDRLLRRSAPTCEIAR